MLSGLSSVLTSVLIITARFVRCLRIRFCVFRERADSKLSLCSHVVGETERWSK